MEITDIFAEQIVARKKTAGQKAVAVAMIVVALALVVFLFLLLQLFCIVPVAAVVYGIWWLVTSMNREVEYSITNEYIDIDEIIARRKRQRLVSVSCNKIKSAGRYTAAQKAMPFDRRVFAASSEKSDNLWFFTYHSKKRGNTLVVFEPNDRVMDAFMSNLPKLVQMDMERMLRETGHTTADNQ